jgi:flagellar L-ring protein FlgH
MSVTDLWGSLASCGRLAIGLPLGIFAIAPTLFAAEKSTASDLDKYLSKVQASGINTATPTTPGSLYSPGARLAALGVDLRATQTNDLLTVIVQERAAAVSKGTVKATRSSSLNASVGSLYGAAPAGLSRLAGLSSNSDLNGEGETTRETNLSTSLTARVVQVMPNGNLIIQGTKEITINDEVQTVVLRGIVRPVDIDTGNAVLSERIADMEVRVNGKGVVGSAIRRPFFLYRLLLGILPF